MNATAQEFSLVSPVRCLAALVLLLAGFGADAQNLSTLAGGAADKKPETPAAPAPGLQDAASVEAVIGEAEAKAGEIEGQIAQQSAHEADPALVAGGVPLEDIQSRTTTLKSLLAAYQQYAFNLHALTDARDQQAKAEQARDSFTKLDQEPPYGVSFLDQLYAQVTAKQMAVEAEKQAVATARQMLDREKGLTDAVKTAVNQAAERANSAPDTDRARAQYVLESVRMDLRASEVRDKYVEAARVRFESRLKRAEAELALAEKQVAVAKSQTLFRPQELEEQKTRQKNAEAEYDREITKARRERDKRQAQVAEFERRLANADPAAPDPALQGDAEIARMRLENSQNMLQMLQSLRGMEAAITETGQIRFEIANPGLGGKARPFQELLADLKDSLTPSENLRNVNEQLARSTRAQVVGLENQAAGLAEGSPERALADRRLAALRELEPLLDRQVVRISDVIAQIHYGISELNEKESSLSLWQRIMMTGDWLGNKAGRMADRELFDVHGESITARKLLKALLILVIGYLAGQFLIRTVFRRFLSRFKIKTNAAAILENLSKYFLLMVVFFAMLKYLNISLTAFTFLGGAIAIGIGFGAQNLISNFLSGLIIMGEQPIRVGDIVEVDGTTGTIMTIGARASLLRTFSGIEVLIPNSKFLENKVVNWTLTDSLLRFDIKVGVAYGSKPRTVVDLMEQAAREHGQVLKDPAPVAVMEDFGENTLAFALYFWISLATTDSRLVRSDLRRKIYKSFQDAGIEFAFPQRDMHLHTTEPIDLRIHTRESDAKAEAPEETPPPKLP